MPMLKLKTAGDIYEAWPRFADTHEFVGIGDAFDCHGDACRVEIISFDDQGHVNLIDETNDRGLELAPGELVQRPAEEPPARPWLV